MKVGSGREFYCPHMVAAQEQVQKALFGVFLIAALLLFAVLLGSVQILALMGFVAVIWALTSALPFTATISPIRCRPEDEGESPCTDCRNMGR